MERKLPSSEKAISSCITAAQQHDCPLYASESLKHAAHVIKQYADRLGDSEMQLMLVRQRDRSRATRDDSAAQNARPVLGKQHTGMRVDHSGLFWQASLALERADLAVYAELLRQLQAHLQELGARWYAGDTAVVDELLQLYCIESSARDAVVAKRDNT